MTLMLHRGGRLASLDEVEAVPTPPSTYTHYPIPHTAMLDTVRKHISGVGWYVVDEEYALASDDAKMFALWHIADGSQQEDYRLAFGLRNSHDMSFAASFAVGHRVFCCDNLAFSSDVIVTRKHTRYILRDLDRVVSHTFGKVMQLRIDQDQRIERYKRTPVTDAQVHDLLIRSLDAKAIVNAQIPKILEEWRKPSYAEFAARTLWSLYNAYTHVAKGTNPFTLVNRTTRLSGLFDMFSEN